MAESVDVVVLGMGPGGEFLANELATSGLTVVGVESALLGGECPYWGCIPSKMMVRAADALAEGRRVPELAGASTLAPDWSPVARRVRKEATDDWDDSGAVRRFRDTGGWFVRGRGRFGGPNRVVVDGEDKREFEARIGVVIATGGVPDIPPIPGLDDTPYWTNHEAIEATTVPDSLCVIGGGAIGMELAQVFARFGSEVTVLEGSDRPLSREEPESSELLAGVLRREGVAVRTGTRAERVSHDGRVFAVTTGGERLRAAELLVSTGRRADLGPLGVERVGIDPDARAVPVDGRMRAAPGVWAVGDVTGKGAFTHVAVYQAGIAAADILGQSPSEAEYHAVPRVTFTDPEVGAVGMTEARAREEARSVRTATVRLPDTARGFIHKAGNDGFVKLVADAEEGVLLGATSAGPSGGEVLGALSVAVHARVPTGRLRSMMCAFPTFHRAVTAALDDL
ncbi:pyruvate/2-oxoglutarate dehydrogenase complex dihydrolipoamide dehydrogenase (E3) component [Haloactinospora alba]|uniref:Pyruvate/2-oxoglutarate dehydrogenase complex dihydrolipoamide dehydrogenase (E3) component n=1 Tax=Haloactinospora alba TaxID=405555 RepID=A0A543NN40_9ACTN|nr:NAD(P)/FAD-dependent oxidoreductase [Haloactinospora alba]TQN33249.1 pyruvate/2-oxoglutarate dehydrogenase complex dihydrolipoamide dehydrogenase (E3) component [Haloactinospora alba]